MNKTTEALKLAEEALARLIGWMETRDMVVAGAERGALATIREVLAKSPVDYDQGFVDGFVDGFETQVSEPVKQEPVAWVNAERNTITWEKIYPNMGPLYAAPVDAKAIRAEALEEAAEIVDSVLGRQNAVSAAIRGLK
jgi:hypothetical protein